VDAQHRLLHGVSGGGLARRAHSLAPSMRAVRLAAGGQAGREAPATAKGLHVSPESQLIAAGTDPRCDAGVPTHDRILEVPCPRA